MNDVREEERLKLVQKYREDEVTKALQGVEVSEIIRRQLVSFRCSGNFWKYLKVVSKDIVITANERSEYGNSGGVGMFWQVRVLHKGQTEMKEWQWRDRYNPNADDPRFYINGIGKIDFASKNGKMVITIELENKNEGNWSTTFTFDDKESDSLSILPVESQNEFARRFEEEVKHALDRMMELWPKKPYMLTSKGQESYRKPSIKQQIVRADIGIGAFVTEEQIDYYLDDRQTQFKLYVYKHGADEAVFINEDHGYEKREGSRVIAIVDLAPERIVVSTQGGQKTFIVS